MKKSEFEFENFWKKKHRKFDVLNCQSFVYIFDFWCK